MKKLFSCFVPVHLWAQEHEETKGITCCYIGRLGCFYMCMWIVYQWKKEVIWLPEHKWCVRAFSVKESPFQTRGVVLWPLNVRTAWLGNKISIVSNWQNFLPSVVASANQKAAWWKQSMFTVVTAPLYLCSQTAPQSILSVSIRWTK